MSFQQLLDSLPISGVFAGFALVALISYESGNRVGRWWQERTPEEKEGPTSMLVGSLLALMGFQLAIAMGMAASRFDERRQILLTEANSIGTTYLRAGYLPQPASGEIRELLREYLPLRITTNDLAGIRSRITRSAEIHARLWSIAEGLARATPESDLLGRFIDSLNEMIDLHEQRVMAGLFARVPETVLLLLVFGSMLTLVMLGYSAGLTGRRALLTAFTLIVVLGAITTLIVDLDRPNRGFLTVSQQPLIDIQGQIEAAAGSAALPSSLPGDPALPAREGVLDPAADSANLAR